MSRDITFYENVFPFEAQEDNTVVAPRVVTFHDTVEATDEGGDQTKVQIEENLEEDTLNASMGEEAHNEGEVHVEPEVQQLAPRSRQPPGYLRDYFCHAATENPICKTLDPSCSSGTVYPISQYVSYDHFSQKD